MNFLIKELGEFLKNISQRVHSRIKLKHTDLSENLTFVVLETNTANIRPQSFTNSRINISNGILSCNVNTLLIVSIFYKSLSLD